MTEIDSNGMLARRQAKLAADISPGEKRSQENAIKKHASFQKGFFRRPELNPVSPDTLYDHSRRTAILTDVLSGMIHSVPYVKEGSYNPDKAFALALVHGDGKSVDEKDKTIVQKMNQRYGSLCWIGKERKPGISYPALVGIQNGSNFCFDPLYGNIVKYANSIDNLCHALHEVRLGNERFNPVIISYRKRIALDLDRPCLLKDLRDRNASHPIFCLEIPEEIPQVSREHILATPSGIKCYDFWIGRVRSELGVEYLL